MKIILFLLIPFILLGQTYLDNLPLTNNAATTVVTNNGTSGAWVASGNTNTLYSTDYGLNCFKMQTNGMYVKSSYNLNISEFYIQWQMRIFNVNAADYEVHFDLNGDGGGATQGNNEIQLWRFTGVDEFSFRYRSNEGTQYTITTTNVTGDNTTMHKYLLYFNTTTFAIKFWIDGVEKTFGSWSPSAAGTITLNQGLIYMGETGTYEPDAYYKNVKFWQPTSNYYVDQVQGLDAYDGRSIYAPWKTIAKVNGATFAANDSIYLRTGSQWRETLTIPHDSLYIAFYDSTGQSLAKPIINGSDIFSSWSSEITTVAVPITSSPAANGDDSHRWRAGWWGTEQYLKSGNDGGTLVDAQCRFQLNIAKNLVIDTAYITLTTKETVLNGAIIGIFAENVDNAGQITNDVNFTTRMGNLTADSTSWTVGAINMDISVNTPAIDQVVQDIVNRTNWTANNYINIYFKARSSSTQKMSMKAYDNGSGYEVLHLTYENPSGTIYYASYTIQPNLVFNDTLCLAQVSAKTSLVTGKCWIDTTNKRIYVYDNPSGHVMTASQRDKAIIISNPDYITVENIKTYGCNAQGIVIAGNSHDIIIKNCITSYNWNHGILTYSSTARIYNILIDNNIVSYNSADGIHISRWSDSVTVSNNEVFGNCWEPTNEFYNGVSTEAAIHIVGIIAPKPVNTIIERNHIYSNGNTADEFDGFGIWFDTDSVNHIIRYNKVHNNTGNGIEIEKTSYVDVYYNLVYNHTSYFADKELGIGIVVYGNHTPIFITASHNKIYNNTLYNNRIGIDISGSDSDNDAVMHNEVINNISSEISGTDPRQFTVWGGGENDGIHGHGNIYTNNCFGTEPLSCAYPSGSTLITTYDALETAYGLTMSNVETNPLLTNPTTDFTLQSNSPCIDAGVNVNLTTDYMGLPVPKNKGVDIGAYEYQLSLGKQFGFPHHKIYKNFLEK